MNTQMRDQATSSNINLKFWRPQHVIQLVSALFCFSSLAQLADSIRFTSVHIPSLVQRNTNFWLSCQFELSEAGNDQLYSVKWYKNNVEFYRFQPNESSASSSTTKSPYLAANNADQQQYFGQAGISIMMGSSNATHVRLLNATLESEGLYACEISTQNLSTIRSEREIRVYVLPRSKLNIIGLKNRYTIGDQVDLICGTDFSRPKPALSWFINGRRIAESSKWFSVELKQLLSGGSRASGEAASSSLFKLNLSLKFKLTLELLAFLSNSLAETQQTSDNGAELAAKQQQIGATTTLQLAHSNQLQQRSNQSQSKQASSSVYGQRKPLFQVDKSSSDPVQSSQFYQLDGGPLILRLKFQCKYRLTEVSDVTFNELVARQVALSAASSDEPDKKQPYPAGPDKERRSSAGGSRESTGRNAIAADHQQVWPEVGPKRLSAGPEVVRLLKSADNQVTQSKCPANKAGLLRALRSSILDGTDSRQSCERGLQELHYDDPLIVLAEATTTRPTSTKLAKLAPPAEATEAGEDLQDIGHDGELDSGEPRRRKRQLERAETNEYSADENISINCSTISALLVGDEHRRAGFARRMLLNEDTYDEPTEEWKSGLTLSPSQLQPGYCGDPLVRRRSLISGRYYTQSNKPGLVHPDDLEGIVALTMTNKSRPDEGGQPLMYLAAGMKSSSKAARQHHQQQHQQRQIANKLQVAYLSLTAEQRWSLGGDPMSPERTLNTKGVAAKLAAAGLGSGPINADSPDSLENGALVPPLLEWFINNQEALNTAANHEADLLQATQPAALKPTGPTRISDEEPAPPTDEEEPSGQLEVLPSIDYAQYFANFDLRPPQQHLPLKLSLDKRHFMTPDSKLRLRCSSTQAQLLWTESSSVSIVTVADEHIQHGWNKLQRQNHHQKPGTNHQVRAKAFNNDQSGNRAAQSGTPSRIQLAGVLILSALSMLT